MRPTHYRYMYYATAPRPERIGSTDLEQKLRLRSIDTKAP